MCPNTHTYLEKKPKSQHWNVARWYIIPPCPYNRHSKEYIITNINMAVLLDSAKLKNLISVFRLAPHLRVRNAMKLAMKLAKYSDDEIADPNFLKLLQRHLLGGSLEACRTIISSDAALWPNGNERHKKRRAIEPTSPPELPPPPIEQTPPSVVPAPCPHREMMLTTVHFPHDDNRDDRNNGATITSAAARRTIVNQRAYLKRKNNGGVDDDALASFGVPRSLARRWCRWQGGQQCLHTGVTMSQRRGRHGVRLLARRQGGGRAEEGAHPLAQQRVGGGSDDDALTLSAIPCLPA